MSENRGCQWCSRILYRIKAKCVASVNVDLLNNGKIRGKLASSAELTSNRNSDDNFLNISESQLMSVACYKLEK